MNVSKPVLSSIVLLAVSAGMWIPWVLDVNVTNFPLDEQGNLKVTQMNGDEAEPSWRVVKVVENFNLTWTPSLDPTWVNSELIDLGSVNVSGYSRMQLYMRITNCTNLYQGEPNEARVRCSVYSLYDYGEKHLFNWWMNWHWGHAGQSLFDAYASPMRETMEPSLRIRLQGSSYTPNGPVLPSISCLVSVGIYLRNE